MINKISVSSVISYIFAAISLTIAIISLVSKEPALTVLVYLFIAVFLMPQINNYLFQRLIKGVKFKDEVVGKKVLQIAMNIIVPLIFLGIIGTINEANLPSSSIESMKVDSGVLTGKYYLNITSDDTATSICDDVVKEVWKALNDFPKVNAAKISIVLQWKNKYGENKSQEGGTLIINEDTVSEFRRYQSVSSLFSDMTGVAYKSVARQMPNILSGMLNN